MSLPQSSLACHGTAITIPDAPPIEDANAYDAAVERIARQRPPLTPEQKRRLRLITAPAPLAATA